MPGSKPDTRLFRASRSHNLPHIRIHVVQPPLHAHIGAGHKALPPLECKHSEETGF